MIRPSGARVLFAHDTLRLIIRKQHPDPCLTCLKPRGINRKGSYRKGFLKVINNPIGLARSKQIGRYRSITNGAEKVCGGQACRQMIPLL